MNELENLQKSLCPNVRPSHAPLFRPQHPLSPLSIAPSVIPNPSLPTPPPPSLQGPLSAHITCRVYPSRQKALAELYAKQQQLLAQQQLARQASAGGGGGGGSGSGTALRGPHSGGSSGGGAAPTSTGGQRCPSIGPPSGTKRLSGQRKSQESQPSPLGPHGGNNNNANSVANVNRMLLNTAPGGGGVGPAGMASPASTSQLPSSTADAAQVGALLGTPVVWLPCLHQRGGGGDRIGHKVQRGGTLLNTLVVAVADEPAGAWWCEAAGPTTALGSWNP